NCLDPGLVAESHRQAGHPPLAISPQSQRLAAFRFRRRPFQVWWQTLSPAGSDYVLSSRGCGVETSAPITHLSPDVPGPSDGSDASVMSVLLRVTWRWSGDGIASCRPCGRVPWYPRLLLAGVHRHRDRPAGLRPRRVESP